MPQHFRKLPVVIKAVRYTGFNADEVYEFLGLGYPGLGRLWHEPILINTLEGPLYADSGDWIIEGVKGEFYPCKPDIFELTYEEVAP